MASSTRKLTDEQFSIATTVDGDRIEKALEETSVQYNNLPLNTIPSMTSKQLFWSFTPAMGVNIQSNLMGFPAGSFYRYWTHPVLQTMHDGLMNPDEYVDVGNFPTQNNITYTGVGKNHLLNPNDINEVKYIWRWENTYYTKKPVIIKELSFMGMWDDGYEYFDTRVGPPIVTPLTPNEKYFRNTFSDTDISNQFQVLIAVDNNLNLDDTTSRTTETRVWRAGAENFMIAPWGNTTEATQGLTFDKWSIYGTNPICGFPDNLIFGVPPDPMNPVDAFVSFVPAGIHIQLKDLEIPIHEYSRIKIVFVFPSYIEVNPEIEVPIEQINDWTNSNTTGYDNEGEISPLATLSFLTNLWSCSMTVLEELDKEQ